MAATSGSQQGLPGSPDGAAVTGDPRRIAGKDAGGLTQDILTNTAGNLQVGLTGMVAGQATEAKQDDAITELQSILAKILAAPSTEAKQDTGNTSLATIAGLDFATQTTLAALLAKIIAAPSTEAKQDTGNTSLATIAGIDFATQTTLAAILAKIIAAPATEAKQDTGNTSLGSIVTNTTGLAGTISGTEQQVDIVAPIPAGSNAIGSVISGGDIAHDAIDSGSPVKVGGQARTTLPASVADADRTQAYFDKVGRLLTARVPRELVTQNSITLTTTSETTLIAAGGAGIFRDISKIIMTNTSPTNVRVDFRDATSGTVRFSIFLQANGGGAVIDAEDIPLVQTTAANNWTAQLSAAVTDVRIFAQAIDDR